MKRSDYTEANRRTWNETADIHADVNLHDLLESFRDPTFNLLDDLELGILTDLGVEGKAVAQLSCNNGRELLSVMRLGADRGVGFDIADDFIAQARRLTEAAGLEDRAEFVRSDVYDIPARFDGSFDLIYVTIGAIGWLPDLERYFEIVSRLLRAGGHLFIYEMHPILDMFEAETGLVIQDSYFRTEPFVDEDEPDYYDPSQRVAGVSYWFHHKLSDVIGGCLCNDLELRHFAEHDHDISMVYRSFQDLATKPPLCYTLVAQKA